MTVKLHDLTLAELRALTRRLGGPDSHKRTDLFEWLLDHYDTQGETP